MAQERFQDHSILIIENLHKLYFNKPDALLDIQKVGYIFWSFFLYISIIIYLPHNKSDPLFLSFVYYLDFKAASSKCHIKNVRELPKH